MYAIVDIETTRGRDRITEIAILFTMLTGIGNEMVRDAPKFYEVASKFTNYYKTRYLWPTMYGSTMVL